MTTAVRCPECSGGLVPSYSRSGVCMACGQQRRNAAQNDREAFLRTRDEFRAAVARFDAAMPAERPLVDLIAERWQVPT